MLVDILDTIVSFVEKRSESNNSFRYVNFADLSKNINKMLALKEYTPKIIKENSQSIENVKNKYNGKITINDLIIG